MHHPKPWPLRHTACASPTSSHWHAHSTTPFHHPMHVLLRPFITRPHGLDPCRPPFQGVVRARCFAQTRQSCFFMKNMLSITLQIALVLSVVFRHILHACTRSGPYFTRSHRILVDSRKVVLRLHPPHRRAMFMTKIAIRRSDRPTVRCLWPILTTHLDVLCDVLDRADVAAKVFEYVFQHVVSLFCCHFRPFPQPPTILLPLRSRQSAEGAGCGVCGAASWYVDDCLHKPTFVCSSRAPLCHRTGFAAQAAPSRMTARRPPWSGRMTHPPRPAVSWCALSWCAQLVAPGLLQGRHQWCVVVVGMCMMLHVVVKHQS